MHVMNRGVRRTPIFHCIDDYRYFMFLMDEAQKGHDCQILAYCLMPNHFHILLGVGKEPPGGFMKHLQMKYAIYFNQVNDCSGHLFEHRYLSVIAKNEAYLTEVSRYIHLNPVKAGIVSKPIQYDYSSYSEYMNTMAYFRKPNVYSGRILSLFDSQDSKRAAEAYKYFVESRLFEHKYESEVQHDISEAPILR